ncbi:DUF5935 domain-containing protein [Novosphingobium piscinae]|uniref:O-antigen ligase family protein n=1 Tax=Novosphingobium piscinae TaxID=1507448 RepID=A0A7X1G092_9SPHN|nr:DUF5935 domain-containing protein [Novosphingobium piscinae]MBC2670240.1 O-antigen ligase family protein [Novosphingobium piscinae]
MLDLALAGFFFALLALGLRRPFVWVLAYLYVDVLMPQKISYFLLASLPVSLIVFVLAFGGWLVLDDKTGGRLSWRQGLILFLLLYCGATTLSADFPEAAAEKWAWVWKTLVFALFLPLVLRTRLRIEAAVLFLVLSAGTIVINGGIKTLAGGGGYGELRTLVSDNAGLYEGSTLSTVAIAIIPLIAWLARHGTVFPPSRLVTLFAVALGFACCLIPIGTQTRTGLICLVLLAVLALRSVKRRMLYLALMATAALAALPFLPESYTARMSTIENHASDQSASTRVAVWKWTLGYVQDHPFGGGFDSYRGNRVTVVMRDVSTSGNQTSISERVAEDKARAFHSAYFEMLGEQGWPGLAVWLVLQLSGLVELELVRRRLRRSTDPADLRDRALAQALQSGHCVYLFGALFIGIAFQPFVFMLIGLQIALCGQVKRRHAATVATVAPRPRWRRPLLRLPVRRPRAVWP